MLDRALPAYVTALRMPVTVAVCPWRLKRNGNRLSSIVLTLVKQVVLNSNTANVILRLSLPQNNHRSKPAPHTPKKRHAVDASFRKRRTFTALPMYTPLRFTSGSSIVSETEKAVSRLNFSCYRSPSPKNRCKGNSTSRCQTAALYAPTVPSDKGIALLPVKYLRGFGKTSLALCLISLLANEKREQTAVCSRIDSIVYALSHLAAVPMSDIRQDAALPAKRPSLQTE